MKLIALTVDNFRSIERETFDIVDVGGSKTYTLIGINESGKSSFLAAISLFDGGRVAYPQDYFDEQKSIRVTLSYELEASDVKALKSDLAAKGFPKELLSRIAVRKVQIVTSFEPRLDADSVVVDEIEFVAPVFEEYTLAGTSPTLKTSEQDPSLDLRAYCAEHLAKRFWKNSHYTTLWRSDNRHLITGPISLDLFAGKPEEVSVPLVNCFALAGIDSNEIPAEIAKLKTDPARIKNLQQKLEDKVTAHIRKIWPGHPIEIRFHIDASSLSFLVEDVGVKYHVKTTQQRSDGFRQFVSFLLTISAENSTGQLSNTLLLLDEPETHLHPQAQEDLLRELIRITSGRDNNVVLFATHSNYMIDKEHLDRCYRVDKVRNRETRVTRITKRDASYAEVNYEVFGIVTTDYHNELYGYLEDVEPTKLRSLPKTHEWFNAKNGQKEVVSLQTYIRHAIHHPENRKNRKFTADEMRKSIEVMRAFKYGSSRKRLPIKSGQPARTAAHGGVVT